MLGTDAAAPMTVKGSAIAIRGGYTASLPFSSLSTTRLAIGNDPTHKTSAQWLDLAITLRLNLYSSLHGGLVSSRFGRPVLQREAGSLIQSLSIILQRFGSELPSYGGFALPWLELDSTCRILVRNSDLVSFGGLLLLFQLISSRWLWFGVSRNFTSTPLRNHREGRRSQHRREFRTEEAKSSVKGGTVVRHVLKISHGGRPVVLISTSTAALSREKNLGSDFWPQTHPRSAPSCDLATTRHTRGGRASIESLFDLRRAELPIGFWGENF
ncbi:hypothetical protein NA56DRAFT_747389 [Hyaloscypha hepaticicola]|uniref:Uncharacterized protein n=1 Tax=Hyaloscypha hepaticicola TaxID=2082293 RepID=A0A2J6Q933_9HELO|nr:hypothetical protein NA56DRAFT_747389 [Hyaloscypha hepaticicola]